MPPHTTGENMLRGQPPVARTRANLHHCRLRIQTRLRQANGFPRSCPLHSRRPLIGFAPDYWRTKIFFFAHMSRRILGQTVTLHSPRCAFLRIAIYVRDWPMPPPIVSGISPFIIIWW